MAVEKPAMTRPDMPPGSAARPAPEAIPAPSVVARETPVDHTPLPALPAPSAIGSTRLAARTPSNTPLPATAPAEKTPTTPEKSPLALSSPATPVTPLLPANPAVKSQLASLGQAITQGRKVEPTSKPETPLVALAPAAQPTPQQDSPVADSARETSTTPLRVTTIGSARPSENQHDRAEDLPRRLVPVVVERQPEIRTAPLAPVINADRYRESTPGPAANVAAPRVGSPASQTPGSAPATKPTGSGLGGFISTKGAELPPIVSAEEHATRRAAGQR